MRIVWVTSMLPGSQREWTAMHSTLTTSLSLSVGEVNATEWAVYCVVVAFKLTEQEEQWICIQFCIKLEHSSTETIWMIQKAAAMGNWWLATRPLMHHISCSFLVKHQVTQVTQAPYSPYLVPYDFWLFQN